MNINTTQRGWTLVELVMVIVIIGILSAVAVPKYFSLANEAELADAEATIGALRSACQIAHLKHRVSGLTATGSTPGDDLWITDGNSLVAYLESGTPENSIIRGRVVTLEDGTTVQILTPETETNAAQLRVLPQRWRPGVGCRGPSPAG